MHPCKISIIQRENHAHIGPLLKILKGMYHVDWNVCGDLSALGSDDAVIAFDADAKWLADLAAREKSTLVFPDRGQWSQSREIKRFEVVQSPEAPEGMSGAWMAGLTKAMVGEWNQEVCRQVVARDAAGAFWLRNRRGGVRVDVAIVDLADEVTYGVFTPAMWQEQLLQLMILIDFVREVTGDSQWAQPGRVASVIFDDPNLHSMRYGFLDYVELLESMRRNNYHVSIATIPIDSWYVSKRVAAFFREHTREYSFVYHGNDHVSNELARTWTQTERAGLVEQALGRIARCEAGAKIEVEKVMVAPHGACSDEMLRELAIHDFQGACISWGSLNHHNRGQSWAMELGLKNTEILHELPVLSRMSFEGAEEKSIRLAMFLHQPIILRGHHDDLRNGLDVLEEKIRLVNELAHPRWDSIGRILKSNFRTRIRSGCLEVRPYARSVDLDVPPGCSTVAVDVAENGFDLWDEKLGEWAFLKLEGGAQEATSRRSDESLVGGGRMRIQRKNRAEQKADGFMQKRAALWPVTRRFLTETRDRMAPYLRR